MANFKDSNKDQGVFISVIPAEQITPGSFDETIQLLVDNVLDISDFESGYNNDHGGASAYPPASLLKIILAAYHRGITSSRKIEQACKHNTIFMALSGFLTPDHSTIAAFVSKSTEKLERLFTEIVLECDYLGLIGGDVFAVDGTKLSSNASKEWSGSKADFEKRYNKIRKAIRYMLKLHREEDERKDVDSSLRQREENQIQKLRSISKKLKSSINTMEDKIGAKGQAKNSNITDPDSATMMSGGSGAQQGYMALAAADNKHQVICAADITGDTEQEAFQPLVEQLQETMDDISDYRALADAGFHTTKNIDFTQTIGLDERQDRQPKGSSDI